MRVQTTPVAICTRLHRGRTWGPAALPGPAMASSLTDAGRPGKSVFGTQRRPPAAVLKRFACVLSIEQLDPRQLFQAAKGRDWPHNDAAVVHPLVDLDLHTGCSDVKFKAKPLSNVLSWLCWPHSLPSALRPHERLTTEPETGRTYYVPGEPKAVQLTSGAKRPRC